MRRSKRRRADPREWYGDLAHAGPIDGGKRADLVLLNANPRERIGNTLAIATVCVRGRWLAGSEFDALFETARECLSRAALLE